jgi:hypothetical protein
MVPAGRLPGRKWVNAKRVQPDLQWLKVLLWNCSSPGALRRRCLYAMRAIVRSLGGLRSWHAPRQASGPIQTPGLDVFANDAEAAQRHQRLQEIPHVTADEVAKAALFLASDDLWLALSCSWTDRRRSESARFYARVPENLEAVAAGHRDQRDAGRVGGAATSAVDVHTPLRRCRPPMRC